MAIRIPDLGTGSGAVGDGDNELKIRQDYNHNFNDQTNAASKLLGTGAGQVPLAKDAFKAAFSNSITAAIGANSGRDCNDFAHGERHTISGVGNINTPPIYSDNYFYYIETISTSYAGGNNSLQIAYGYTTDAMFFRRQTNGIWGNWVSMNLGSRVYWEVTAGAPNMVIGADGIMRRTTSIAYTNTNTTKDSNGFIKAASPIVKVHANSVVLNEEAEQQNVTYKKNGIGDYTITTVSGLSTDGWYIELPKDMNGNPKVAIGTLVDNDGVITLKTYKRMFSMKTFTFEPDLDNPLDIPDGRWIDLRLNEIPVEIEDDIQPEV